MKALRLDQRLTTALLDRTLNHAPEYERFAPAARHAIRVLHGLPGLFDDVGLDEMEIYIGRTAFRPEHLRGRFGEHRREKRHAYGVVLFRCATKNVLIWERAANRLVTRLERERALCVANATAGGQGRLPAARQSCIYLTWRRRARRECRPIEARRLDMLARDVHRGDLGLALDSVRRGIRAIADPRDRLRVRWACSSRAG